MEKIFNLMIAQLNPIVGDLDGNLEKVYEICSETKTESIDVIAFPEMFLTGYQLQDLVLKRAFLLDTEQKLDDLKNELNPDIAVLIGAPILEDNRVYNAYHLITERSRRVISRKHHLPNNDVFDEKRVFSSGAISRSFCVNGIKIGSPICEDFWHQDVSKKMLSTGAELFISPNGSPYSRTKLELRADVMRKRSEESNIPLVYLNMVGGQDDLIFDGGSFVMNPGGEIVESLPQFEEEVRIIKFEKHNDRWLANRGKIYISGSDISQDYRAMVESTKDYVKKSGFSKVLLGLSGGIDSALVSVIACDAFGPENVLCVRMPSEFTSKQSLTDAESLTEVLGCKQETISINTLNNQLSESLANIFLNYKADLTEENMQSRLRGIILMALSNKFNMLLLTTGNKSEVAVGYSTIYGDMAGGYNPIKDLYKTRVFETCRWRNKSYEDWMKAPEGPVIPTAIIDKAPSAELRHNQRDDDSLPPYGVLDEVLKGLIDEDLSVREVVEKGFDKKIVKYLEELIYKSEYKRFQAAPGAHLTERSLWSSRRYPLVQKWRDKL